MPIWRECGEWRKTDVPIYVGWAQCFAKSQMGTLRQRKAADVWWFLEEQTTAAKRLGLSHRVSCHTLRGSFTTHLLLEHSDVNRTMIYTHVLNWPAVAVRSPANRRRLTGANCVSRGVGARSADGSE